MSDDEMPELKPLPLKGGRQQKPRRTYYVRVARPAFYVVDTQCPADGRAEPKGWVGTIQLTDSALAEIERAWQVINKWQETIGEVYKRRD